MTASFGRALGLIAALLLGATASAQPVELTGTDVVLLWWEEADGPVATYEAQLSYADGTADESVIGLPPQEFMPRRGIPFQLSVRACWQADPLNVVCDGPWSEPSAELRLCPLRSDIDCNLLVNTSDFVILSQDWQEAADE